LNRDEFHYWIDISPPKRTANVVVELAGWCFPKEGGAPAQLRVRIRNLLGSKVFGTFARPSRPDVAAAFPTHRTSPECGFHFRVPLRLGANVLELEARAGGHWALITRTHVWRLPRAFQRGRNPWPKDAPLVSVVIPCYNQGRYVLDALESVRWQTFSRVEAIIVNDGSDDPETIEILSGIREAMVVNQPNLKLPSARNTGINRARGKWICCLDADDRLAPTYLEKCLFLLETDDLDLCGSLQRNFGDSTADLNPGRFTLEHLLRENCMIAGAVFRKELWKRVGGYDSKMVSGYEDWEFWIRLAKAGARAAVIEEPLFFYRKHGHSMIDDATAQHSRIASYIQRKHSDCYRNPGRVARMDAARAHRFPPIGYDSLVSAPVSHRRTILLAMPFLTIGGAETIVSQLCAHLSRMEFRFVIVTTTPALEEQGDSTAWFEAATFEIFHLPRFLDLSKWPDFLDYLIESRPVDILWQVGSTYTYGQLPRIKQRFPGLRVIDLLLNPFGHTADFMKYNYLIDHVVTEHNEMRAWLTERGESEDVISVAPNGIDLQRFRPRPKESWRVKQGLPAQDAMPFVVGFFGRLSEEKAPDIFIEIAAQFRQRRDIEFIVAGSGPMEQEIRAVIATRTLKNVHFLGFVAAEEYMACCDVLVVCSRFDGRPNVVMESQAMGVPVIASRAGALPEMIEPGRTGLLVDVGDVDGFTRAIQDILNNPERHEQMRRSAREWAEERFSIIRSVEKYAEIFEKLAIGAA
jgi:glycosyltransferase involved in cell wall biosynthesis